MNIPIETLKNLPSPYYRVATRAIVLDDQRRLLVMENKGGEIELPGGGLEFDESYERCLAREVVEELGVEVASIGPFIGIYQGRGSRGVMYLRIAFKVELKSYDFRPGDMERAWFVTREELEALDLSSAAENGVKQLAEQIWS